MRFRESLRNTRYFFRWLGDLVQKWFMPLHYDENGEATRVAETPPKAPESSPPPLPAEQTEATEADGSYDSPYGTSDLSTVLAFRGAMNQQAMAAVLGKSSEELTLEIESLMDYSMLEDLGDGRYLLLEAERRRLLRADSSFAGWLSRFQHTEMEESVLEVIEQLCRQLPMKIMAGKSLVLHLRQRKWMVWQSRPQQCRVKLFGTLSHDAWSHLRAIDKRARRLPGRHPRRGWNPNEWVTFRWPVGADALAIESVLLEAGREFQKQARRRGKPGRSRRSQATASGTSSG